MAVNHRIDLSQGIVFSDAEGMLTDEDMLTQSSKLRSDPNFHSGLSQLFDASRVEKIRISSECVRRLAMRNPFGAGSRRACVVSSPIGYGLARMYQILTSHTPDEFAVFRDIDEAMEWLGLVSEVAKTRPSRNVSGL